MSYRAVGFDYGGVIAGPTSKEFNKHVCDFLGVDLDTYHKAYFQFNNLMNNGQISRQELSRMVLDTLGKGERYDAFIEFQAQLLTFA